MNHRHVRTLVGGCIMWLAVAAPGMCHGPDDHVGPINYNNDLKIECWAQLGSPDNGSTAQEMDYLTIRAGGGQNKVRFFNNSTTTTHYYNLYYRFDVAFDTYVWKTITQDPNYPTSDNSIYAGIAAQDDLEYPVYPQDTQILGCSGQYNCWSEVEAKEGSQGWTGASHDHAITIDPF